MTKRKPTFTFIDLFAGIGGNRTAFQAAGGSCVFTSEWNKFAVRTYESNFPCDHEIFGDITQVDSGFIPKHDVLLGGFPCQPFSLAGGATNPARPYLAPFERYCRIFLASAHWSHDKPSRLRG